MHTMPRVIRRFVVLGGVLSGLLLPVVDVSLTAGLLAVVLTLIVVTVVVSCVFGTPVAAHRRARAALDRLVPRTAQSDPDACGDARPRAPGLLLTAV